MKYTYWIFIFISCTVMAQQTTTKSAFLEKWSNSKEYLLEIASSMPDDKYGYKPTEREMDFKNQLIHICANMMWLSTTYFSDSVFDRKVFADNAPETKTEIVELLNTSFDSVYKKVKDIKTEELTNEVDFFAGKKSKLQILNLLQDHVTHHRGQLIIYLNLNQIKPPRYVGW